MPEHSLRLKVYKHFELGNILPLLTPCARLMCRTRHDKEAHRQDLKTRTCLLLQGLPWPLRDVEG